MQTPTKAELITYAIALAFVLIVHILPWMANACDSEAWSQIMKSAGPSCAEFWINRYQTAWAGLLGAASALSAAWVAWHSIQVQIRRDEAASIEGFRRNRDYQNQQFGREIATLEMVQKRITKFKEELSDALGTPSNQYADALTRTLPPSAVGMMLGPNSNAGNEFATWCQRLIEIRGQAHMNFQEALQSGTVRDKARARLAEIDRQIFEEVGQGSHIHDAAETEIAALRGKIQNNS